MVEEGILLNEIRKCPFCGGEAVLIEDEPTKGCCFVECCDCTSRGPISDKQAAIRLWNERDSDLVRLFGLDD